MSDRWTGRTTRQIEAAPKGAVYVWPVAFSLGYPRAIAHSLGRLDLQIVSRSWLSYDRACANQRPVVIDHAVGSLDYGESQALSIIRLRGVPIHYHTESLK